MSDRWFRYSSLVTLSSRAVIVCAAAPLPNEYDANSLSS